MLASRTLTLYFLSRVKIKQFNQTNLVYSWIQHHIILELEKITMSNMAKKTECRNMKKQMQNFIKHYCAGTSTTQEWKVQTQTFLLHKSMPCSNSHQWTVFQRNERICEIQSLLQFTELTLILSIAFVTKSTNVCKGLKTYRELPANTILISQLFLCIPKVAQPYEFNRQIKSTQIDAFTRSKITGGNPTHILFPVNPNIIPKHAAQFQFHHL